MSENNESSSRSPSSQIKHSSSSGITSHIPVPFNNGKRHSIVLNELKSNTSIDKTDDSPTISKQTTTTTPNRNRTPLKPTLSLTSPNNINNSPRSTPDSTKQLSRFQQFRTEQKLLKQKSSNDEIPISFNSSANNSKSLDRLIKQARVNGCLNLSTYNLNEIPKKVLRINIDKADDADDGQDGDDENKFKWWEQINLQKLIIASNKIKEIPKDIQYLDTLITFDVSLKIKNQAQLMSYFDLI